MKVLILYFSGTGNTYFIADKIKNALSKKNHDIYLSSVENFQPEETKNFDVLILGYPIYACDMPVFLQNYIKKLTVPKTKKVIIFSTMAMLAANSAAKTNKRLIELGMIPLHFEEIKMPGSDGLVFMKKDSPYIQKLLSTNFNESKEINKSINNIVNAIDNVELHNENVNQLKAPAIKLSGLIVGGLMGTTYKLVENKLKTKFWANDKCLRCHLCENICPSHNIKVTEQKVIFSDKCYLCMRCINQCPVQAIQIGKRTNGKFRWKGPSRDYTPKKSLSLNDMGTSK